ncbi:MAG TPA: MFS transporter [Streptosporangiaceae bacterium]|nr:MFS transporter [Streptosporangiaceae bacterium]
MPEVAGYRGLFAQPVLRRLAVADVCARLPQGMVSLTLLLVAAQHASMTVAGLVVAGYTLGQAATGPARGRRADRRGLVPVAAVCAAGYALALAALLAAAAGLYAPLLAVAAPLAGLCLGPTLATLFGAAARAAPPGHGTETQAWINSIMNGGAAGRGRAGRGRLGPARARPWRGRGRRGRGRRCRWHAPRSVRKE